MVKLVDSKMALARNKTVSTSSCTSGSASGIHQGPGASATSSPASLPTEVHLFLPR